ncbi:Cys-tRNA(Pro) deacylase YbaK [Lachnospiraceae bacterium KM106-2]|nr:Cys-tRNA(Pro) deacylase YbaK [Lachnospiraceae bacterium KM106-2]
MVKTNAMRMLSKAKIAFRTEEYEVDESDLSGEHVASQLNQNVEQVFKTLVIKGERKGTMVFCLPVNHEIDLKKAAKVAGDKKVEMLHMKDLLSTTGYIRGGCSPIGMKKRFPTFIEETCLQYDEIYISAGVRGAQIILNPNDLIEYLGITVCDFVV